MVSRYVTVHQNVEFVFRDPDTMSINIERAMEIICMSQRHVTNETNIWPAWSAANAEINIPY